MVWCKTRPTNAWCGAKQGRQTRMVWRKTRPTNARCVAKQGRRRAWCGAKHGRHARGVARNMADERAWCGAKHYHLMRSVARYMVHVAKYLESVHIQSLSRLQIECICRIMATERQIHYYCQDCYCCSENLRGEEHHVPFL